MRSKMIMGLILLNVLLLVTLIFHKSLISTANAQLAGRIAPPSEYLMVSGEVQGGNGGVIFIIDTRNNWLTARTYNNSSGTMEDMPPIDLARQFK